MFEADLFCRKKLLILVSLSYCLFWIWYFKLYWMLTEFFASMDTILFEYYELKHIKQRAIVCCINSNILQNIRHSTAWIMSTRAHQYFLPWTAVIGLIDGSNSNWCICSWWNIDHRLRDLYFLQMMMHRDFHFLLFPAVVFMILVICLCCWLAAGTVWRASVPAVFSYWSLVNFVMVWGISSSTGIIKAIAWPVHLNWAVLNKWVNDLTVLWEFWLISMLSEFLHFQYYNLKFFGSYNLTMIRLYIDNSLHLSVTTLT